MEWWVCQSWHSQKIFVWTARQMKWQKTTKKLVDTAKADLPTNDKGKLGDSGKKLEILQKVCEILVFPDQDLGRGGNEYLLKYYLFYAWFNFTCYHPPWATLGQVQPFRPGSGELFEAVLSRGEGGLGQIKKYLLFDFAKYRLFLTWFTWWLRTSRLHILKEKCRNLSESGWGGIIYPN